MSRRLRLRTFGWPGSAALAVALLLDRCGRGFRLVRAAIRRGELERRSAFDVSPLGTANLRVLKCYLRRTGYVRV